MSRSKVAAGVCLFLQACAVAPSPQLDALQAEFERTVPVCDGEVDCKAKWEAAQIWIIHNSDYKIQTISDNLIDTYGPYESQNGATNCGVQVSKEPMGDGKYKILAVIACRDIYGNFALPTKWERSIAFNEAISAVKP